MSNVILIRFHVKPTETTIMPAGRAGAYVVCYCGADSIEKAVKESVTQLMSDGMVPEETLEPYEQMDSSDWREHIVDDYPEYADQMQSQAEFDEAMNEGRVVYGPIAAYAPQ